jgi:phosphate acyltransferase
MLIAIDAMGGDLAPYEIVKGAIIAARELKVAIALVGHPEAIQGTFQALQKEGLGHQDLDIKIVPSYQVVEMGEHPATALRKKKDASIAVTARCVAGKEESLPKADAMVAAGSTGAAMASALFNIGRIQRVIRPAIAVMLPSSVAGKNCMLIDAGANTDSTPDMLYQFAKMGHVFMKDVRGIAKPKIGLLNIGSEPGKGNAFVNAVYPLLAEETGLNFIGNIEGRDLFKGVVDVAVCDGFSGNIALKSAEGLAGMFSALLKQELKQSWQSKLGALLSKKAFAGVKKHIDPDEFGGALLLGLRGNCVIAHGGSKAGAIVNAVRVAKEAVQAGVLQTIHSDLAADLGADSLEEGVLSL